MTVLTIMASPRRTGSTATMLKWAEAEIEEAGHKVERVDVGDVAIGGCLACQGCKTPEHRLCVQDDGLINDVYTTMIQADAIVFATPLYCWSFPGQVKGLIDRMYCLVADFHANPAYDSYVKDKPMGLLVTCGGPVEGNCEPLMEMWTRMTAFLKTRDAARLVVPFCRGPQDLPPEAREEARDFARRLLRPSDAKTT